ncbi:MAG: hypothetical protein AAFY72_13520 [Cyanobacteria bacterium J06649_4]
MYSEVTVEKGCLLPQKAGLTVIQRSRTHPYLWIRLRRDEAGYVVGCVGSSVGAIAWNDGSGFTGDRNTPGTESASCRIRKERTEADQEKD